MFRVFEGNDRTKILKEVERVIRIETDRQNVRVLLRTETARVDTTIAASQEDTQMVGKMRANLMIS